jgi:molybdate transport system ATP-binding protein
MNAASESLPGDILIRLEAVTLRVGGRWILPDSSWTLRVGQHWVVMGPNGSGKTSLTAALTGEVPVVAGRRWLNPAVIREQDMARLAFDTHQGLIARDEARDEARGFAGIDDPGLSAGTLLATAGSGSPTLAAVARRLTLTALLDQPIRSLSTGEMRRLLMARALLRRPRLLILDEPFDGLDSSMRKQFAAMISDLAQNGLQIILVTHRREEMLPFMTHYLVLGEDHIREQGPLPAARPVEPGATRPTSVTLPPSSAGEIRGQLGTNTSAPMIRMDNVCVTYGERQVLRNLNWRVYPGENWLVSGPNGAGKSTLLEMISADHLQAYANAIFLFGRRRGSGESIWEIKQQIGLVSSALQVRYRQKLSGFEVVLSGFFDSVGLFRRASPTQRAQAREWIARLKIEALAEAPFVRLSSGQRRMVLIARAVVKAPALLILDEPCQGLDARNRKRVLAMVEHIGAQTTTNLLFTTHHADEHPPCMTHELRLSTDGAWEVHGPAPGRPQSVQ